MGWFKDFFFADRDEEYEKTEVAKPKKRGKTSATDPIGTNN